MRVNPKSGKRRLLERRNPRKQRTPPNRSSRIDRLPRMILNNGLISYAAIHQICSRNLELARVHNGHLVVWLSRVGSLFLDFLDHVLAFNDLSKYGVASIQPRSLHNNYDVVSICCDIEYSQVSMAYCLTLTVVMKNWLPFVLGWCPKESNK